MNINQSKRLSNGARQNFERRPATEHDTNHRNFAMDSSVKLHDMNVPQRPNAPTNSSRVRNHRCAALQDGGWEYKIGIARVNSTAARKDAQEFFSNAWGRRGWIFVSENEGIFHFKRLKQ